MDAVILKAGVVMAAGLLLLVPTFNALNQSYVQNVPPPPWIPKDVTPPDITPPSDMTPPPDFKPPPDYKGKIPPQSCPPPLVQKVGEFYDNMTPMPTYSKDLPMKVPNGAAVVQGYVNFTNWEAAQIQVTMSGPDNTTMWSPATVQGSAVFAQPTVTSNSFFYNSTESDRPPAAGTWVVHMSSQFPIQGAINLIFAAAIPCGGLASR